MELKYSLLEGGKWLDSHSSKEAIVASRRKFENPYAHLDDTGSFSALSSTQTVVRSPNSALNESRRLLQDPYAYLDDRGEFSAAWDGVSVQDVAYPKLRSKQGFDYSSFRRGSRKKSHRRHSNVEIEQLAIDLQKQMWTDRRSIWPSSIISDPLDILDTSVAFGLIGFNYDIAETLGQYFINGKQVEVAGLIDDTKDQVWISRKFSPEIRNFTAAHEFGHALLHDARGLHRDRPLDGSITARDKFEFEADRFASYFLMPEKLVRARFESLFLTQQFLLNEDTIFALGEESTFYAKTTRELSRKLASAECYNGIRFRSLATQFGVSVQAMAIRIEELGLLAN